VINVKNVLTRWFVSRYSIGALIGTAISILILGMVLSVGAMFTAQMKATVTDANATNILDKVLVAFGTFADWINPLAFISISAVVILILVGVYLRLRGAIGVSE